MKMVRLEDVVDILDNLRVPINSTERLKRLGSVPYYGATGQVGTIDGALFNEPLILLGEDGVPFFDDNKHKAYLIEGPAWVNNHAHVLRPKKEFIEINFLLHFLNQFNYFGYVNGATRLKLTQSDMKRIPIPLPPLPEQKAIVEKLDAAFAEIDKLEANLETKSRYTNELLNSILGSTFSGDNADPNPHQGPAVKMVELGDIASIQTGKIDVNKAVPGGKYPFFTCSKDTYKIDEAPFEGKVILVAGNGDLNVKYYEGKFNAYQRTYFLFVNNEEIVFPKYLYYFLESYVGQLRAESIGSTIKYIKMGNLTDAEMPLPSLPEQKAIVEKLDTAFAEIDKLREWTKQAKQSFSALRQSILSSVFTEKSDAA
jgi:type I restriction enzyme S subunit